VQRGQIILRPPHENMVAFKAATCGGLVPDTEGIIADTPMNAKRAGVKKGSSNSKSGSSLS
jgi:hypothetical protein